MPQLGEREEQLKQQALDMGASLEEVETISPSSVSDYGVPAKAVTEEEIGYSESDFQGDILPDPINLDIPLEPVTIDKIPPKEKEINTMAVPASLLSGVTDLQSTYLTIAQEYAATGKSETYDQIRDSLLPEIHESLVGAVGEAVADPDMTIEDVEALQKDLKTFLHNLPAIDLSLEAALKAGATAQYRAGLDEDSRRVQEYLTASYNRIASPTQHIMELKESLRVDLADQTSLPGMFFQAFLTYMPGLAFSTGLHLDDLIETLEAQGFELDNAPMGADWIFQGTGRQSIRDKLRELDPENREVFVRSIINFMRDNSDDLVFGNVYQNLELVQSLLGSYVGERTLEEDEWEMVFDNILGGMDILFGASALIENAKATKRILPTNLARNTTATAPEIEREVITEVLSDQSGTTARSLNTSNEELIENYVLPKPTDEVDAIPAGISEAVREDLSDVASVFKELKERTGSVANFMEDALQNPSILFQDRWNELAQKTVKKKLKASYNQGMSKYAFNGDKNAIEVEAVFSKTDTHGWSTQIGAQEDAFARVPKAYHDDIIFMKRDGRDVVEVERKSLGEGLVEGMMDQGEYFYKIKRDFDIDPDELDLTGLFSDDVKVFGNPFITRATTDPDIYTPASGARGNLAKDIQFGLQHELVQLFNKHIVKPLKLKQQFKVMDVLEKGDAELTIYPVDTLVSRFGLNKEEIRAYYVSQAISRNYHAIDDAQLIKELLHKDMKKVVIPDLEFEVFAKPKSIGEAKKVEYVYDPVTQRVERITPSQVDELYADGGLIVKSHKIVGDDTDLVSNIVLRKREGSSFSIDEVPKFGALPYHPGLINRYYNENVFVVRRMRVRVDGQWRDMERAIAASNTEGGARAIVSKLDNPELYEVRLGRELTEDAVTGFRDDLRTLRGPRFSKRGERIGGENESFDEALADIANPLESLLKTGNSIIGRRTMGTLSKVEQQRWLNSFRKYSKEKDINGETVFPSSEGMINKGLIGKDLDKAITQYRYIRDNLQGYQDGRAWKTNMIKLASMFERQGPNVLSRALVDVVGEHGNPTHLLRKTAFLTYLAHNPFRQLPMQLQQFSFIAAADPVSAKNSVKQIVGLSHALAMLDNPMYKKHLSKLGKDVYLEWGFSSQDELINAAKAFKRSGIPFSINGNSLVRQNVRDLSETIDLSKNPSKAKQLSKGAIKAFSFPSKIAQAGGFSAGEYGNLGMSWLFFRNKFIKANGRPPRTRAEWDKIGQDAREATFSMTAPGEFSYQQNGIASVIFQFLSAQHKAWLAPFKTKAFTPAERFRIAATQVGLYGATAFGLGSLAFGLRESAGIDLGSEEANQAFDEVLSYGVGQSVANALLTMATGEKQTIDFSDYSATAGMRDTVLNYTKTAVLGESPLYRLMPATSALGQISEGIAWFKDHISADLAGDEVDPGDYFKILLSFTGGGAQYLKAEAAQRYGQAVATTGELLIDQTELQSSLQKWFGLQSRNTKGLYTFSNRGVSSVAIENAQKEMAKEIFDRVRKDIVFLEESGPGNLNKMMLDKTLEWLPTLMKGMQPNDAAAVEDHLRQLMNKDLEKSRADSVFERLMDAIYENKYGNDWRDIVDKLRSSGIAVNPEHKELLKKAQDHWEKYVEIGSEEQQ